jgi:phage major head subunit gpT-like protein
MTLKPQQNQSQLSISATAVFDIDAAADGSSAAALPKFRMVAYTGGPMRVAGWRYPVIIDLAGLSIPSQARPIRFGHDPLSGVGHTDAIRVESGQLIATGIVSRDTPAAREVVVSSKNGFPWQASVGAGVDEFEFVKEGQKVTVNGTQYSGPVNVVRKSSLGEISFVDLGADGATSASVAAQASSTPGEPNMDDSQTPIQDDPNATPATPVAPNPATPEPVTTQPEVNAAIEAMRSAHATELDRIAGIRRIYNGALPSLEAQAIREGWNLEKAELEKIRGTRPAVAAVHVTNNTISASVLEAACFMAANLTNIEEVADEQSLELAARRFRGGIGLQELILEAAWANGYSGRNFRDHRAVMRAAFGNSIEASSVSNIDIGGILSNVANKFLLDGFYSVERVWRNICAVRNVSDFKTVTSYRLIGKDQYELVAPGGELKHGNLGNESYTNRADTYGLMMAVDRRDIINDDLGAITTVPRKLGRGSGLKINDVFWTVFLANSGFFTVGNKNFLSGTDTVLSIDGLTKAEVAYYDLVDSDGKPIGTMPAIMLVPTALSAIGSQLYKSLEMRDNTANARIPINNPHVGKFRVEVSRYLANALYTGNSSKAWYLITDPNDLPLIEVAFLNGQEAPTIETADADFNVLGVQMRGYHDFGVALQDPRAAIKCKGEA